MKLGSKEKIHTEVLGNLRSVAESHVKMIQGTRLHLSCMWYQAFLQVTLGFTGGKKNESMQY